jgi:hypothetical protein
VSQTEFAILDGATVSTAELNVLDGVTATAAELNILDGVTATTAEINILDGVTSTATELNLLDGALDHNTATWEAGTATEPGVPSPAEIKAAIDALSSGVLLKRHRVESTSEISLSASFPADATAPQDNEGLEVLTYDYTPEASDSTIRVLFLAPQINGGNGTAAAIFAAGSSDARATGMMQPTGGSQAGSVLFAEAEFASTGTSARKISVRLGQILGGTATVNRNASYFGTFRISMIIEEYAA